MVETTQQTYTPTTHGVTAFTRPWIVAMSITGAQSVLIEIEVGAGTDEWAKVASPYVEASEHHVVEVDKGRSRMRVTPSGGASYEVTNV